MKDIPAEARPREKLLSGGAGALADAELVALLLRTGVRGTSVLQLAQQLLDRFGGINGLLCARPAELESVRGLGPAKRAEITAVLELVRRGLAEQLAERPALDAPDKVKEYLRLQLGGLDHEVFAVMFLDSQAHLLALEPMFRGTLAQASVYPREIVKRALTLNAASVILAHNHPSGVAEPSAADVSLTRSLGAALRLVDIRVLDHIVVGGDSAVSFSERGLL